MQKVRKIERQWQIKGSAPYWIQSCCLILYLQNIKMLGNQTVSTNAANMFALNRFEQDCYYKPVRVDFCPISRSNNQTQSIIPFFNNDGNFFTPAFILPRQKITIRQNLKSEQIKFQARVNHSSIPTEDKTPEFKPTDDNHCQLCQSDFQDYWNHINGNYHKKKINSSKFNKEILVLCENSDQLNRKQLSCKTKTIEKNDLKHRHNTKNKLYKTEKQFISQSKKIKDSIETLQSQVKNSQLYSTKSQKKKALEQSLKIILQLGNYNTNLINGGTFKQFYNNS